MLCHCLPPSCTAASIGAVGQCTEVQGSASQHGSVHCVLVSHCLQSVTVQKGEMAQGKAGLTLGEHHHWDQLCRAHS